MGAGNFMPSRNIDSVGYYVDFEAIYGADYWENESQDFQYEWEDFKTELFEAIKNAIPSMDFINKWENDNFVLCENRLLQVVIGDNQSSAAVYIIIPEYGNFINLASKQLYNVADKVKKILLSYYPDSVSIRNCAWTSSKITN